MRHRVSVHSFHSPRPLSALDAPVAETIERPPMICRLLRFDRSEVAPVGLAILHEVGLEAADPSNSYAVFYRVRGAGLGDKLVGNGFDDSLVANTLANGTNGILLFHQAYGATSLAVVHAGARSPAGKKFVNALIKSIKESNLGIKSNGKRVSNIDI